MLDSLIRYSITNKLIVSLFTLALMAWGTYALTQLPIDAVPDITNNQVQVITSAPTLAAQEVERLITYPVEVTLATIPNIEEIRSFSRFGLSVVTIVFKEEVEVYWARQQVNERMPTIEAQIPAGIGRPGLAPITTGLGEIYQYVVHTKDGYASKYSPADLRSIQDWIVRRQLLGTPGVADVSSFGGILKQYEVAVDPTLLNAMQVSIADVFEALEANNENAGGAYIEKNRNAYFIRTEGLVNSLDDIRNIAVKNTAEGIPVLIRDVAKVQLGAAVRYGATTRNGEGEVVSAIVMMLKGANSAEVIKNVKSRIADIQKTLPEGVVIEPFLDRSKLVDKAISTVATNLAEGALIVIFVLLLMLGNFRAGLIVASVIPLALLFAFGMMNLFGVSGNLMSLGAIDFGLIVDGAVIIVEATLHHLGLLTLGRRLSQSEMDEEVYQSASKIRGSAAFGELIILIVYLPILALVGTEGKMFRPMAQTVAFAILGAFILSLTYVPMMSAKFLSKKGGHRPNISDKIMRFFHRLYGPLIRWAMHSRALIIISASLMLAIALYVFSGLGGEFIPTLDEGDFAVETRVITGSSLENTIDATTRAEKILLSKFPEVIQVVSKIGAGEIPTDPMPIEAADLMIILKDKSEWVSATSREELADRMAEALEEIPGVTFGFQQPIQMRFNELMSGARQDVVVKIYGDDLQTLTDYAQQLNRIVNTVKGAEDIYVEEVTGVPQLVVKYQRTQLAKYGVSVAQVNQAIEAAFAGATAGMVYEGERRYELVVRLQKNNRTDFEAIRNLNITRADGHQVPISQLATVNLQDGPYQIQRDNTRRRISVAFNARNRDVESIVHELRQKVSEGLVLAPGYAVTYGGQFENLVQAKQRLSIALPAALILILALLFFTFRSVPQSLLIFTAIPLSAIGGVFALWLRDMPFSISAGVGFIALFGVAVLNGIVLIAEFNNLKKEGCNNIYERIYKGTNVRLRPVLMTALVASLGFLPMAISASSGAEVQRPLATVVIGGLISATLLTLLVLPVLYYYSEKGFKWNAKHIAALTLLLLICSGQPIVAQHEQASNIPLDSLIKLSLKHNPTMQVAQLKNEQQKALLGTSINLPATNFGLEYGQTNSYYTNDSRFSINQGFEFPGVYTRQHKLAQAKMHSNAWLLTNQRNELISQITASYYTLWYQQNRHTYLLQQDSLYKLSVKASDLRLKTGEANLLESINAQTQSAGLQLVIKESVNSINLSLKLLQYLINTSGTITIRSDTLQARLLPGYSDSLLTAQNPYLSLKKQEQLIAHQATRVEKAQLLPDFSIGYFNQSLNGPAETPDGSLVVNSSSDRFSGIQAGISVPLWAKPQLARIKVANLQEQIAGAETMVYENELKAKLASLTQQVHAYGNMLEYYRDNALPQAKLIRKQAKLGFDNGQIDYIHYSQAIQQALDIQLNHLSQLNQYNQTIIQIEFLLGIQPN